MSQPKHLGDEAENLESQPHPGFEVHPIGRALGESQGIAEVAKRAETAGGASRSSQPSLRYAASLLLQLFVVLVVIAGLVVLGPWMGF